VKPTEAILLEQILGPIGRPIEVFTSLRRSRAMNAMPDNNDVLVKAASADEDLRQRVCRCLAHSGHHPARSLDVRASGGTVTLRGNVPTYYVRQLAIACVQRVAGVRCVVDEIQMELPAWSKPGSLRSCK
jgi:osmotically-inducible protein OsmY